MTSFALGQSEPLWLSRRHESVARSSVSIVMERERSCSAVVIAVAEVCSRRADLVAADMASCTPLHRRRSQLTGPATTEIDHVSADRTEMTRKGRVHTQAYRMHPPPHVSTDACIPTSRNVMSPKPPDEGRGDGMEPPDSPSHKSESHGHLAQVVRIM